jgi:hypothetical protein
VERNTSRVALVGRHLRTFGVLAVAAPTVPLGLGSRYRSVRSSDWLKFKKPEAPALKREAKRIAADEYALDG